MSVRDNKRWKGRDNKVERECVSQREKDRWKGRERMIDRDQGKA